MEFLKEFKKLDGHPWSVWKKCMDELRVPEPPEEKKETKRLLPRSDMALYGITPKTEIFELVVCNYCGYRYKCSAFADHIRLRHSSDNTSSPMPSSSYSILKNNESLRLKRKSKIVKAAPSKEQESQDNKKLSVNVSVKIDEVKGDPDSLPYYLLLIAKDNDTNPSRVREKNTSEGNESISSDNICSRGENPPTDENNSSESKLKNKIKFPDGSSTNTSYITRFNIQNHIPQQGYESISSLPFGQTVPHTSINSFQMPMTPSTSSSGSDDDQKKTDSSNFHQVDRLPSINFDTVEKPPSISIKIEENKRIHESTQYTPPSTSQKTFDSSSTSSLLISSTVTEVQQSESSAKANQAIKTPTTESHPNNSYQSIVLLEWPKSILCQLNSRKPRSKLSVLLDTKSKDGCVKGSKENFIRKQLKNCRMVQSGLKGGEWPKNFLKTEKRPIRVTNKTEAETVWHPGFRRSGGLLYGNSNLPHFNGSVKTPQPCRLEEPPSCVTQLHINSNLNKGNDSFDLCRNVSIKTQLEQPSCVTQLLINNNLNKGNDSFDLCRNVSIKTQLENVSSSKKDVITSLKKEDIVKVQKNNHPMRLVSNQSFNGNKASNSKRPATNNMKGEPPKKNKKQENVNNINTVVLQRSPLVSSTINLPCSGSVSDGVEFGSILPSIFYVTSSGATSNMSEILYETPPYQLISDVPSSLNTSSASGVLIINKPVNKRINGIVKK